MTQTPTCESEALLQAYLDDELSADERAQVDAHVADCATCQEALDELQVLGSQLAQMFTAREQDAVKVAVPGVKPAQPKPLAQPVAQPVAKPAQPVATAATTSSEGVVTTGYRVVSEIAKGGFGTVYKAIQLSMDRPVALKILAPHLAENEEFVARFLREARVAATITHPNLVTIYDVGQSGAKLYYSMELIEGEDVEEILLRDGFVPPERAAEIALGVAKALVAAKQTGVIHRDIKPANVMVSRNGLVKLADLGLAKALEGPEDNTITMRKKVIGSPNYMSPEQAKDLRKADHVSDLYSLGATLLHMISGQKPFGSGSPVEIIARVLKDPIELPAMTPGGDKLPPALAEVIERTMAKDPADRYAEPSELVDALQAYLGGVAAVARPARSPSGTGRSGRSSGTGRVSGRGQIKARASARPRKIKGSSGEVPTRRHVPQRANNQWGLAIAAALLLGIGLVILKVTRSDPAPQPSPVAQTSPRASRTPRPSPSVRRVSDAQPSPSARADETTAAELALASLEGWIAEHPERLGERYRRAQELVETWPNDQVAGRARELRDDAGARLEEAYGEAKTKARGFEDADRWHAAKQVYMGFVEEHGAHVPGAVEAEVAVAALDTQIEVKLEADRAKLTQLAEQGAGAEADDLVLAIARYAGPDEQERARAKLEELRRKDPQPGASPAADPRLGEARGLLAQVRELIDGKDYGGALVKLGELKKAAESLAELDPSLGGEVAKLEAELKDKQGGDQPETPAVELGELVKAYFHGDVTRVEGQAVTIVYDFSDEEQGADFESLPGPGGKNSPKLYEWLEENTRDSRTESWSVRSGRLLGYGWTRGAFLAKLKTSDPIQVEVTVRGGDNMLIGLGESYEKAVVAGLGFLLPELPIARISNEIEPGDDKNGYLRRLKRTLDQSRERGPSAVVLRENRGLLQFDTLVAEAMRPKSKMTYSLEVSPDGDTSAIAMRIGRANVEESAPLPTKATLFFTTFGAAVKYDDLTISGTLTDDFVQLLRDAAKHNGGKAEGIRQAADDLVRERREADRKREEAERERKEEERRRKEEEEKAKGDKGDGDKDQGDKDDKGDDGDKDDEGGDALDDLWNEWGDLSPEERRKRLAELSPADRERLRERWAEWRKNNGGGGD